MLFYFKKTLNLSKLLILTNYKFIVKFLFIIKCIILNQHHKPIKIGIDS